MSHEYAKGYHGLLAQGLGRETDLATLAVYLQRFSADELLETLLPRLSGEEVAALFEAVGGAMRRHLSEAEYHRLFLGAL